MAAIDIEEIRGDAEKRNAFIEAYKPFIAGCVYSVTGRRVEYGVDDELSVALLGFNHAIDRFDGRGSFLSFAKLVIKNRLFDYYRQNARHTAQEPLFDEEDRENYKLVDKSLDTAKSDDDASELRDEIVELSEQLRALNINFKELALISPKHRAKRKKINEIVQFILSDEEANKYFLNTKNIPLKLIEDKLDTSRKNIEPYRKYIIALIVIANSDYYYLKEYLSL